MAWQDAEPTVALGSLEMFAHGVDHAEGICVTIDGTLYVSGEAGQIYRLEPDDTATQVATTGGWTLGLAADAAGRVYACDAVKHAIYRWTPGQEHPELFSAGPAHAPLGTPNWGAFGPDGSYYVSDSGGWQAQDGRIIAVRPGRGRTAEVWSAESADFPNGLAVSPDGSELWVLESTPARLVKYAIGADGSAGSREVVTELPGTVPDGIAFAMDGSVVIACYRPDVVLRWSPQDGLEILAIDPQGVVLAAPTNCVFTGPERSLIVVPNIGRWHVTRFSAPGLVGAPLFYPTPELIDR